MITQNNYYKNWQDQTFSHLGLFFLGNYKFVRSVGKMSHYRARCSNNFWMKFFHFIETPKLRFENFFCALSDSPGLSVLAYKAVESFDSKLQLNYDQFSVLFQRWVFRQLRYFSISLKSLTFICSIWQILGVKWCSLIFVNNENMTLIN